MIKCKNCDTNLSAESKFCTNCGAKIDIYETTTDNSTLAEDTTSTAHLKENTANLVSSISENENIQKVKSVVSENENLQKAKTLIKNNKKASKIIGLVLVAFVAIFILSATLGNTPKKALTSFCKSMSKMDVEKAMTFTNFDSVYKTLLGDYGSSLLSSTKDQVILELQKDLMRNTKSMKFEVIDMAEIAKNNKIATYDVTLKITEVSSSGSSDFDINTETMTFVKDGSKWKLDVTSFDF